MKMEATDDRSILLPAIIQQNGRFELKTNKF